ncbi:MAG: TSUP family transporter, partial [Gammaproteobacteria bacterium]
NVDWAYLRQSARFIVPAALVGVFGLINLPNTWLLVFIYSVTLFYAGIWVLDWSIHSHHDGVDKLLLIIGGYVAGTSLTGAPLIVAVYMRHVAKARLRDTLFVLWFTLVAIKMSAFAALGVDLQLPLALALLPVAAIGHVLGLRAHQAILRNDRRFRRWTGAGLLLVSGLGLARLYL